MIFQTLLKKSSKKEISNWNESGKKYLKERILHSISFHISHKPSVVWASFVSFHMEKLKPGKRREKNKAVKNPQKRVFTISLVPFFIYRTSSLPFARLIHISSTKTRKWDETQKGDAEKRFKVHVNQVNRLICVTWLIHTCDMTHLCYCFFCHWDMTHLYATHWYVRHDSFICETWRIHTRDMIGSYVRHTSFTCATWHMHTQDMSYSWERERERERARESERESEREGEREREREEEKERERERERDVRHYSFEFVTWLIYTWDMTHLYVRHDSTHVWLQKTTNSKIEMFKKKIDWVFTTHCNTLQHIATAEKHEYQDRNVQEENRLGL